MSRALTTSPLPSQPAGVSVQHIVLEDTGLPTPPPGPFKIEPSNNPVVRLAQADAFFRRNPGYMKTSGIGDVIRGATANIPGVNKLTSFFAPSEFGFGKLIRDQVNWQVKSTRQPENEWWMNMNRHLIGDPLNAEAHIRAGREIELTTPAEHAWAAFIHDSDRVRGVMGVQPGQLDVVNRNGELTPVALSDAYRGVSLLERAKTQVVYKAAARNALWQAHKASLVEGRAESGPLAASVDKRRPREMSFASSWANVVGYWAKFNPPAMGEQALWAQRHLLPDTQIESDTKLPPVVAGFVKVLGALDHHYETEIHPPDTA